MLNEALYIFLLLSVLFMLSIQATTAQCDAISNAYVEITTADVQSEDRYCGAYLAASADGDGDAGGDKAAGFVYGKSKERLTYIYFYQGIII